MTKYMKLIALCVVILAALLAVATGANLKSLDVVGRNSITSFGEILKSIPDHIATNGTEWSLTAPDKSARFLWSVEEVVLELNAEPFVKAGLNPEKLPDNYAFSEDSGKVVLSVGVKWGQSEPAAAADSTAIATYAHIVDARRDIINYHSFLDHYGVKVGGDNMFEWAKNMATNEYDNTVQDKDIVFALNPKPLVEAGVDPEKIDGWLYAQVPVMAGGSTALECKLLKPFNLK